MGHKPNAYLFLAKKGLRVKIAAVDCATCNMYIELPELLFTAQLSCVAVTSMLLHNILLQKDSGTENTINVTVTSVHLLGMKIWSATKDSHQRISLYHLDLLGLDLGNVRDGL